MNLENQSEFSREMRIAENDEWSGAEGLLHRYHPCLFVHGFFCPLFSSFILHPDGGGSTHVLSSNLFNPGMKRALHPNAYTIIKEE